jgi:anti-anti-sigma factor
MTAPGSDDALTIEKHGDVLVVIASHNLERMPAGFAEGAAALILEPLRQAETPLLLIDLADVRSFGSPFLAMIIRCWRTVSERGGNLALSGVSAGVRNLLTLTRFDTLWPIYATRREAMEALNSD